MNAEMKAVIEEVEQAQEVVRKKLSLLRNVCDHQDESGSWARTYDSCIGENVCRYCREEL